MDVLANIWEKRSANIQNLENNLKYELSDLRKNTDCRG